MELTNCKLNHIKATKFTDNERQIIKKAVQRLVTRRPNFYHDAIIEKAQKVMEESSDTPNNG